jgi:hypothetical protein
LIATAELLKTLPFGTPAGREKKEGRPSATISIGKTASVVEDPVLMNSRITGDELPEVALRPGELAEGRSSGSTENSTNDKLKDLEYLQIRGRSSQTGQHASLLREFCLNPTSMLCKRPPREGGDDLQTPLADVREEPRVAKSDQANPFSASLPPPWWPRSEKKTLESARFAPSASLLRETSPDPAPILAGHHGRPPGGGAGYQQTLLANAMARLQTGIKPKSTRATLEPKLPLLFTWISRSPLPSHRRPAAPSDKAWDWAGFPWETLNGA